MLQSPYSKASMELLCIERVFQYVKQNHILAPANRNIFYNMFTHYLDSFFGSL